MVRASTPTSEMPSRVRTAKDHIKATGDLGKFTDLASVPGRTSVSNDILPTDLPT